jgi:hypothetical protein
MDSSGASDEPKLKMDCRNLCVVPNVMNTGHIVIGHTFYQSLIPISYFYCQEFFLIRRFLNFLDKRSLKIVQVGMTYYQLFDMVFFHDSKKEGV